MSQDTSVKIDYKITAELGDYKLILDTAKNHRVGYITFSKNNTSLDLNIYLATNNEQNKNELKEDSIALESLIHTILNGEVHIAIPNETERTILQAYSKILKSINEPESD